MIDMVPMYGFGVGGGGGTGATLTVTAPAGCTVTVSKDGKSKTKYSGLYGTAVFKGLSTGTWTLTITDGEQTAQKTVTVTTDYAVELTFFSATIHITYTAGTTCTVSDGVTTLIAPDTSGTWYCVVPNSGSWTVTVVNKGWTDTVELTESGQSVEVDLTVYYLYKAGDEYTLRTGGWDFAPWGATTPFNKTQGSKKADRISLYSGIGECAVWTKNAIDVTNFSTIHIKFKSNSYMAYGIYDTYGSTDTNANSPVNKETYVLTDTADISSQKGSYYFWIGTYGHGQSYGGEISEVWLT